MMNQEEKELLIKDLCARAQYGVICYDEVQQERGIFKQFEYEGFGRIHNGRGLRFIENIKPYLRSMSSMTDEEFKEYHSMLIDIDKSGLMIQKQITRVVDWLDCKMFDHRGLIPKRLAFKAPEGMYKSD